MTAPAARAFPYGGVSARTMANDSATTIGVDGLRPLLVDAKQAAHLLGIGCTTLYELINVGAVATVRIGRCVRFSVAELERFVASGCPVAADSHVRPTVDKARSRRRPPARPTA